MGKGTTVKSEADEALHTPIMFFGKDLMEIKCFRNSFICGICCGMVGGLACFLGTSKTLFSTHVGFASIWIGVFAYWIPCRYKFESQFLALEEAKERALKKKYSEPSENENDKKDGS